MNAEITPRDYFAVNCPYDYLAVTKNEIKHYFGKGSDEELTSDEKKEYECLLRYKYADIMMEAREKTKGVADE